MLLTELAGKGPHTETAGTDWGAAPQDTHAAEIATAAKQPDTRLRFE